MCTCHLLRGELLTRQRWRLNGISCFAFLLFMCRAAKCRARPFLCCERNNRRTSGRSFKRSIRIRLTRFGSHDSGLHDVSRCGNTCHIYICKKLNAVRFYLGQHGSTWSQNSARSKLYSLERNAQRLLGHSVHSLRFGCWLIAAEGYGSRLGGCWLIAQGSGPSA